MAKIHLPLQAAILVLGGFFVSLGAAEPSLKEWRVVTFVQHPAGSLELDVVRPDDGDKHAAVLCFQGGFWVKGTREDIDPLATDLAKQDYVGVSCSYRLTGVAAFPAQLEDVRAAIRHLREQADRYGIDPDRIGVVGSSAGGHLAVLAATDGNLRCATRDAVVIFTPQGAELGRVLLPGLCTSVAFAADGNDHLVAVTTREAAHVARFRFT
jgi:acetyl esterase/lipase